LRGLRQDIVVMFPDLGGKGMNGDFGVSMVEVRKGNPLIKALVPIVNGLDEESLRSLTGEGRNNGFDPVISSSKGLGPVLIDGYRFVMKQYPKAVVVRMDTAEQDPFYIPRLAKTARSIEGMVIGDLSFDKTTMIEGSIDWFVHMRIFPILYGYSSNQHLLLSCAHGFQAFHPNVLSTVFGGAQTILKEAGEILGTPMQWGLDGAMALSAFYHGIHTEIIKVPATILRNRDEEKIAKQFSHSLAVCIAADRVFRT